MTRFHATRLESADALERLRSEWSALWARDPHATPFQSPAWLIPWWNCFAPGQLWTTALWDADSLCALAPLYLEEGETRRLLPVGISLSDHLDLLAQDDEAAHAMFEAVLDDMPCDRLDLEDLMPQAHGLRIACAEEWRAEVAPAKPCPTLMLGAAWDSHVPGRKRRQWRRAMRAAQRRADMRVTSGLEDCNRFLDDLFRLHAMRWQDRGEAGVLADERVQRFHRTALPGLVAAGLARLYLLHLDGRIAGAYYGLSTGQCAYAYIGGFDPEFSEESPGTILIGHALAQAQAEGARSFDFLRGAEDYKYAWGAQDVFNARRIWRRL